MEELRYVVLRHTGIPDRHFDLMVEPAVDAMALVTWRLSTWPLVGVQTVQRLTDHRPAYLTYEGPVSGDRGKVHRVRGGTCWVQRDNEVFVVTFDRGEVVRLWPAGDGSWLAAIVGNVRGLETQA